MSTSWRILAMAVILSFFPQVGRAQRTGFSASVGLASQRMDDLKYIQQYILDTYPVEGKITSSFPPFTNVSLNLVREGYDKLQYGGGYSFSTTGGKSSYVDYSGKIATEMDVTSHRLGAFFSYSILGGERLDLSLFGRADVNFSLVNIESALSIGTYINQIIDQYRSISPSGTAGTDLMYHFNGFSVGVYAAYLVDLQGSMKDTGGAGDLTDPNDRDRILTTDWTGWQLGFKTLIWLDF
jgi:hypothetical protein